MTPGEAAYQAYLMSLGQPDTALHFYELRPQDQMRWNAVADAVILCAKSIIADEMVRVVMKAESVMQQRTEALTAQPEGGAK